MNEKFSVNVFIKLDAMDKLDRSFYDKYYCYRRVLANKSKLKNDTLIKKALNDVNSAYEKIKNCTSSDLKENGEYSYPLVAFKRRQEGTDKNYSLYACVADTKCNKKIDVGNLFSLLPFYLSGDINEKGENVSIETTVGNLLKAYKGVLPYADRRYITICKDIASSLSDFPASSILEINFNSLIPKDELLDCINEFKESIEKIKSKKCVMA